MTEQPRGRVTRYYTCGVVGDIFKFFVLSTENIRITKQVSHSMLISEYFTTGINQRSAIFRLKMYLSGKDLDYKIFYNVEGLEKKVDECMELPEKFDHDILGKMRTDGFFKDKRYVVVQLKGKLQEYKDMKHETSINQNFVDEYNRCNDFKR